MAGLAAESNQNGPLGERVTLAGHRIYAWFIAFAGVGGLITCLTNGARGLTDPAMLLVGTASSFFCFACSALIFALPRYRRVFILASGAVLYAVLVFLALHAQILYSSPSVYLTALVVANTFVLGPRCSLAGLGLTLTTYLYLYFQYHAENPITPAGGSFIDWRTTLFLMCAMATLLYLSSVIFRTQMMSVVRSYAEATARAEASDRATSAFLANMSHEIRTPMNGVLGMIDVALDTELPAAARDSLVVAQRSASSLIRVLSDVLDLSKLQSGGVKVSVQPTDPKELLTDTALLFSASARAKGLQLVLDVGDLPAWVSLDSGRAGQILSNLIGNAIKFTDEGQIRLAASYHEGSLTYTVQDTGMGMPDKFLPHVFDRFQQAEMSLSQRRGGTGLGLAICRELTELMGGTIRVESQVGDGTTFTVQLPAPETAIPEHEGDDGWDRIPKLSEKSLTVLVAEDNRVNQAVVQAFLKRLGHRCVIVDDGRAAIEALDVHDFGLLLLDISMPVLDGIEVIKHVRSLDDARAALPVLMLTAHIGPDYLAACRAAGADGVLHKPLKITDLADALRPYCDAPAGDHELPAEAS